MMGWFQVIGVLAVVFVSWLFTWDGSFGDDTEETGGRLISAKTCHL